ncbi:hypothetical protein FRX31_017338 [Thalictrum thalictroides]|uniref:Uncharacterized protein n=1 Tax=Thalictrum thalictroides TaxID=46969 RepID=A0A7J6W814_THATH|nr:hypothetical protein FRX31_017338 [Thalictrum thalictroides]
MFFITSVKRHKNSKLKSRVFFGVFWDGKEQELMKPLRDSFVTVLRTCPLNFKPIRVCFIVGSVTLCVSTPFW